MRFFTSQGWPILVLGILATSFITCYIYQSTRDEDRLRFAYEAEEAIKRIQNRMERFEGTLIQVRAFLLSSEAVSHQEFLEYFEKTRLLDRYPGIMGLGLTVRIDPDEVSSHVHKLRKQIPGYHVWPEGKRDVYFSIQYLAPENVKNKRAQGYDMFTEPRRREAMHRAWVTGLPAITGKIALVQEYSDETKPGFNYYVPFYRNGVPLETVEDRKKHLVGFVYSPFLAQETFSSIFNDVRMDLDIEIFDNHVMSDESLLFDYDHKARFKSKKSSDLNITKEITIAGRPFTLHFVPSHRFKHRYSFYFPLFSAIAGFLITLLFYRIFWISRKQAEQSHEAELALQDAVKARDEFLSIASHELKTPLTSLKLQVQVTKRIMETSGQPLSPEKMKALVNQTERQSLRLERLVDDMLDISRIRTGRLTIEKEEFELCELIRDIVSRMHEQFRGIPDGAPKVTYCEESMGLWDKMRLEQVITNLLTNAIKYGKNNTIEVHVSSTPNTVVVKVKDYGLGVPPEFTEKIFNRFERAGVSTQGISGLGLGLFITRQIVLSHKGNIWVESNQSEGSTFVVELPRHA